MKKAKILIIEDEKDIIELVEYNLEREGYHVAAAKSGEEALNLLKTEKPDLVILDLMLPGMDGLEICRIIKQDPKGMNVPIIMLTAKSEEADVVIGLQMGADDYVTKPFSPKVLLARVKALLRRISEKGQSDEVRTIGDLKIDMPKHKVTFKGKVIDLTTIEFNILEFLSRHPGRVFSRDQIMDKVWNEGKFIIDRAVDVHIRGLRKKMENAEDLIETVRGVGYRFKDPEDKDE